MDLNELDRIAREASEGRLWVHKAIQNSEGRHAIQFHVQWAPDSWYRFVNPNGWQDSLDACIEQELSEIEERIAMDIYGTDLFPYIAGEMLAGKGRVALTIKDVREVDMANNRSSATKPVVYFKERKKGLVLNKTNAKVIVGLYGRETDDWRGKRIWIYAEQGEWFGQAGYAIRVVPEKPTNGNGSHPPQTVDEIPFDAEPPWDDELAESQDGQALTYENGTEVKDEGEAVAFEAYVENEGKRPPSRAALMRWAG